MTNDINNVLNSALNALNSNNEGANNYKDIQEDVENNTSPKRKGSKLMYKGMQSLNPNGRPKGALNKATLLYNTLRKHGLNVEAELARLLKSTKVQDKDKLTALVNILKYIHPTMKISENEVSVSNNTFVISWQPPITTAAAATAQILDAVEVVDQTDKD